MTETNTRRHQVTAALLDGTLAFEGIARLTRTGGVWAGDVITNTLPVDLTSLSALEGFLAGAYVTFPSGETIEVEVPSVAINTTDPAGPAAALAAFSGIAPEADGRTPVFALNIRMASLPGLPASDI